MNMFIRFHAAQSLVVFGTLTILAMIPVVGWFLTPLIGLVGVVLWVFLMIKTYQGYRFGLPVAGELAQRLEKEIG